MPQDLDPATFEIDHVIPEKMDGGTVEYNLALACFKCNNHKGPNIAGIDPYSGEKAFLYDPRKHIRSAGWQPGFHCQLIPRTIPVAFWRPDVATAHLGPVGLVLDRLTRGMRTVCRNWRRSTLIGASVVIAMSFAAPIVTLRHAAEREYASYDMLCSLDATGDDWVSVFEIVTGRSPIVQLEVPATIPVDTAFDLMPDLRNLEALTLGYQTFTDSMRVRSRRLSTSFKSPGPSVDVCF